MVSKGQRIEGGGAAATSSKKGKLSKLRPLSGFSGGLLPVIDASSMRIGAHHRGAQIPLIGACTSNSSG